MPRRSLESLHALLDTHEVVQFDDLRAALDDASRATTFRYLKRLPYHRSYNHNSRYYTRRDPARYDPFGLFSIGDVHFSRDGSLGQTLIRLVCESSAGWTQRELERLLHVRVSVLLLEAVRRDQIARQKLERVYLYVHPEPALRHAQLQHRREQIDSHTRDRQRDEERALSDAVVIEVLLVLIRHPGSSPTQVARRLRGHAPPIPIAEIRLVFDRYELEELGKKGGPSNC